MKLILSIMVLYGLIAIHLAAPLDDSAHARILFYDNDNIGLDGYDFSFETSDGIKRDESAELVDTGTGEKIWRVEGYYSWTAPDGKQYRVDFVADENGYRPTGAHLP
ncbi:PREDICTED: flexible cuticle protein 12-like [Rhagoletis zephyria]|uniref:flexible cuticle protein 12-like n=1 Tax=Rhagoletis zephyria TaxID=28612 RepID=UPI0008116E57|nr:PREDICTED: flexible cuticle protein 12-like [Rhagoletis zephyria]